MAIWLAIFGMICWGIAPIFGKVGLSKVDPMIALSLRTMMASTLIFGWLLYSKSYNNFWEIPFKFWIFIAIEAFLATLIGDLAYFGAIKYGNINDVTLIMASSPLVTIVFSYLLLDEKIYGHQLLGAILIIGGLILITIKG